MEILKLNLVNKKQNGLEQIENEKHKSLARARADVAHATWHTFSPSIFSYLH